jgi:molecular chaperone GrpE
MSENTQTAENIENTDEPTLASGEITKEKSAEAILTEKLAHADEKYKYLYADFENYKKRAIKERQDVMKFGAENTVTELLPVLDNLDRALQYAKAETDPNLMSGLKMVAQQFKAALEKQGVAEISTTDQAFNPELHEAVGQIPNEKAAGTIVQEQQKGYTIHGRLLRASRVLLSSGSLTNKT